MAVNRDELSGLDELFRYKNQLIGDLLKDDKILKLLSPDGGEICKNPKDLVYKQVFPYEFIPDTVEHGGAYICCEVDIKDIDERTPHLYPVLYVWEFAHKSKLRLNAGGVRTDALASRITSLLNGSRMYGLGELKLKSVRRFAPAANYQGRVLTFTAKDYNLTAGSVTLKIPSNRRVGV